jgi:hypothetical protein
MLAYAQECLDPGQREGVKCQQQQLMSMRGAKGKHHERRCSAGMQAVGRGAQLTRPEMHATATHACSCVEPRRQDHVCKPNLLDVAMAQDFTKAYDQVKRQNEAIRVQYDQVKRQHDVIRTDYDKVRRQNHVIRTDYDMLQKAFQESQERM